MRYCRDCVYFENLYDGKPEICSRFKKEFVKSEDPVYGAKMAFAAPTCRIAREASGQCGPLGRFWIAREGTEPWLEARIAEREAEVKARVELSWWKKLFTW